MTTDFFTKNRNKLSELLEGGLVVLTAHSQMQRSNDMAFAFEQESNFWYLTGVNHADWKLIIDGASSTSWLVAPTVESVQEVFDGSLDWEETKKISGIKHIIAEEELTRFIQGLRKRHDLVYTLGVHPYKKYFSFVENPAQNEMKKSLERTFSSVRDCRKELTKLRAIKQPQEIKAIEKAIALTSSGFEAVKQKLDTYGYEYEIEADFTHHFRKVGSPGHAYSPIVAAGKNACRLHYVDNDSKLKKGQLLLLDVGARVDGYAADISRTYSVGAVSKRQQEVFDAVQSAQQEIIALLGPDTLVEEYTRSVDKIMKRAMTQLSLVKDSEDGSAFRKYMPHAVSHGLGIDVHDSLGAPRVFEPGMVLTVEPGIYVPEESIGVRIEDDILITSSGSKNLSRKLSTSL